MLDEDDRSLGLGDDLDDAEIQLRPFDASSVRHAINDLEDVFSTSSADFRDIEVGDDDRGALLGHKDADGSSSSRGSRSSTSASASNAQTQFSWYELGFYQRFFDIRTKDLLARVIDALLIRQFRHDVDNVPDLYGPLWISTTVIFLVAATANFASYLHAKAGQDTASNWHYDFDIMTQAALVFYAIITVLPAIVWGCLVFQLQINKRLVSVISIYGYSLVSFVPATLVCAAASDGLRWMAVVACFVASTVFLVRNLWALIDLDDGIDRSAASKQRQHSYLLIGSIVVAQLILSIMLKLWFFSF